MQYYKCVNCIQPLNSEVGYCIISILIHSKKMETRKKMGENEYGVDHKPQKDTPLDMSGVGWSWVWSNFHGGFIISFISYFEIMKELSSC